VASVASSANRHGNLELSVSTYGSYLELSRYRPTSLVLRHNYDFYLATSDDLKGVGMLGRFGSTAFISAELLSSPLRCWVRGKFVTSLRDSIRFSTLPRAYALG
jgi:hypothetical protein